MDTALPILVALAIGVGFAVGTGTIADRKGYNFVLFAFLGFFLGIVGLIIAAVVPKRKAVHQES